MQLRYRALGTIANVYQIIGAFITIGAVLLAILAVINAIFNRSPIYTGYGYIQPNLIGQLISAAGILIGGGITGIATYAVGEFFHLLRDLELNTREAAACAEETALYTRQSAALLQQLLQRRSQQPTVPRQTGEYDPR